MSQFYGICNVSLMFEVFDVKMHQYTVHSVQTYLLNLISTIYSQVYC